MRASGGSPAHGNARGRLPKAARQDATRGSESVNTEGMLPRPFPARSAFKAVPARWSGSSSKVGCRGWVRTIIAGSKIRSPACWTTRQKMCPRQELHLRPQGPQPCVLSAELRGRKNGATARTCTRLPPIPRARIAFYASAANCDMPVTLRPIHVGNVVSC